MKHALKDLGDTALFVDQIDGHPVVAFCLLLIDIDHQWKFRGSLEFFLQLGESFGILFRVGDGNCDRVQIGKLFVAS